MTGSPASVADDATIEERIALLGEFDPRRLIGLGDAEAPPEEHCLTLSRLADLCREIARPGCRVHWSMEPDSRRRALGTLVRNGRLHAVAHRSEPESGDHLGQAMKRLVIGRTGNPVLMSRDEIEATYRACQFLRPVGIDYDVSKLEKIMRHW